MIKIVYTSLLKHKISSDKIVKYALPSVLKISYLFLMADYQKSDGKFLLIMIWIILN